MERNGRSALAVVLLIAAAALLLALTDATAEALPGRARRHSPWLNRAPNTFMLGKKFARNRPSAGTTHALETNTDWPGVRPMATERPLATLSTEDAEDKPAPRSRSFYGCMSNCLTLSQYNPVCGTDHTTYHNEYKLECANRCGAKPRVSVKKLGIC
ncbi:uncharacterized protein LOC128726974 [Anopheles nili]|uniref:uncharacterized protein LOC128726974 n=1 Tax=Anopheles nili TaxID=185578 RepID=UPI00237B1F38|nr:uncharacterized protein LOC128726974 [Anopheles nili]